MFWGSMHFFVIPSSMWAVKTYVCWVDIKEYTDLRLTWLIPFILVQYRIAYCRFTRMFFFPRETVPLSTNVLVGIEKQPTNQKTNDKKNEQLRDQPSKHKKRILNFVTSCAQLKVKNLLWSKGKNRKPKGRSISHRSRSSVAAGAWRQWSQWVLRKWDPHGFKRSAHTWISRRPDAWCMLKRLFATCAKDHKLASDQFNFVYNRTLFF